MWALLVSALWLQSCVVTAPKPTFTNPLGMEFVRIEPGSMLVGKYQPTVGEPGKGDPGRKTLPDSIYRVAEKMAAQAAMPGFKVTLDQPFYIGKYEVTQEQWEKVMGHNPSFFQGDKVSDDATKHPVENISWQDAQVFVRRLSALDKKHEYRLPTEFEWEYAARAGADDDIPWAEINKIAVLGGTTTSAIGQKQPNAWGLYDMLGNVWEWVEDYYNKKLFADPVPPQFGEEHVLKGASFTGDVKNATYKTHAAGPGNGFDVGLRVVMEAKQ
ncbi:formylglycine-generating enzyme required for sulfatase activity [Pontibacter ummariensis]|uniref:Formylglycine-generating enzyme, required for sulfatase activity, contains SUMF1/FGE domain n=2 Tax=Pontibacter ummariensis TaxID=1610492 RepID=A0A239IQY5_9BACT|nr:formylglycine-generating enzyme required for sulfatase activity [Pontibacter ummariensis]SNS95979.1 Formylglycine-generating enzyme, required for sulfatase activity, contains SUMF1/FGE domain [Pontibacter ummariensis]